jgi:ABC-type dipeptide/oligopeptide/nickel transport system permease subunit
MRSSTQTTKTDGKLAKKRAADLPGHRSRAHGKLLTRGLGRHPASLAVLGLVILLAYAVFVPMTNAVDPRAVDYGLGAVPPAPGHWFGTDLMGRDLFVRSASALQVSLFAALVGALAAVFVGACTGMVSALVGGLTDRMFMRLLDGFNAVPHLLLGIIVASAFRGSLGSIVAVIAVTHWTHTARLVRAEILSVKERSWILASINQGMTRLQLLRYHLVPHLAAQLSVSVGLLIPHAIWHETTLSFLGLGLPPHQPSLGALIQLSQQSLLSGAWWTLAFPVGLLVVSTLCIAGISRRKENACGTQ